MAILTVAVVACVSLLVVPVVLVLCAEGKEKSKPRLKSVKKNTSKAQEYRRSSTKSNGSSHRQSKTEAKEEVTVVTNGSALAAYEEVAGTSDSDLPAASAASANTYEEPEAVLSNAKQINDALTNGTEAAVVNETSPASSQRSSRASNGQQSRVVSQDRALPDIPGQPTRHSVTIEKSPSTKRALPDLPPTGGDEGADLYDQLQRDVHPQQMRSKASSVKVQTRINIEEDLDMSGVIEPDEVTRSSIIFGPVFSSPSGNAMYSSVSEPPTSHDKSAEHSKAATSSGTKPKVQYSKVKKESSSSDSGAKSPGFHTVEEPVYSEAPPVPDKLYDADAEAAGRGAAGAGGVAIIIDENAQDSGSGYYAVADAGPALNMVPAPSASLGASYDILTARESIASVRARQAEGLATDEDYYESMDDKPGETATTAPAIAANKSFTDSTTEIYAEIDNPSSAATPPGGVANHLRPPTNLREELYDEIDPVSTRAKPPDAPSKLLAPSHFSDSDYERVDFTTTKGEQTDSAGYAIVKESSAAATASSPPINDDEEDYAECDMLPAGPGASSLPVPSIPNINLSRSGSDVSDYATVSFNGVDGESAEPSVPSSAAQSEQSSGSNQGRPYQKYDRKKEHFYQEIDEVRDETKKNPPDKKT